MILFLCSFFLDSTDISSKGCWEYGSKLENPYTKLESSYSKLESTYSKLESPYSKLENPYSKLESHYSKLDTSPYSKLESHYTSSLASQHFNNIKMDPQQGKGRVKKNPEFSTLVIVKNQEKNKFFIVLK